MTGQNVTSGLKQGRTVTGVVIGQTSDNEDAAISCPAGVLFYHGFRG